MIAEMYKGGKLRHKTPAEEALDRIAKLCGCPVWEYPGQVVRDVEMLVETLRVARQLLRHDDLGQAMFLAQRVSDEEFGLSEEFVQLVAKFNKGTEDLLKRWETPDVSVPT